MKTDIYIAKTFQGLEEVLAQELRDLGAQHVQLLKRAVRFEGDQALMYRANLWLRTALCILKPIYSFQAADERELYEGVRDVSWNRYLDGRGTLAVDSVVHSDIFTHSKYVALKTKDAIVDQFRDYTGHRPSVDVEDPDLRVHVHIAGEEVTLALDSSGRNLDRRGYRLEQNIAPLNEVLAAGLIKLSGWDPSTPFIDGMCGSGTLLIEAAMMARNFAPGRYRKAFGFMYWPDFDHYAWEKIKADSIAAERETDTEIVGSDISVSAIRIASANITRAQLDEDIRLSVKPFGERIPPKTPGTLIINPPYGERMNPEDLDALYAHIGATLKKQYTGYTACVFTGNVAATRHIGLRAFRRTPLYNGGIECRLMGYRLFEGSEEEYRAQSRS